MKKTLLGKLSFVALLSLSLVACQKEETLSIENSENNLSEVSLAGKGILPGDVELTFYALAGNMLDKYSTSNPEMLISSANISGLQSGERILGIDFRPLTGQLYALGSNSRIYIINPTTGVATFVAALTTTQAGSTTAVPLLLEGTTFGFDFNPVPDRIRIVSNTGQSLRVNPMTGVTIVDGRINNPTSAQITGVAYDNNDTDPTTGTELYALDPTTDLLYEVDPPNNGTLINPLPIKLKIEGDGGFDIATIDMMDYALALYEVNKKSTLFYINVETGDTRILAKYNKNIMYSAFAISPQ